MSWTTPISQQPDWGTLSISPMTIGERVLPRDDYTTAAKMRFSMSSILESKLWEGDINLVTPIIRAPQWTSGGGGDGGGDGGSTRPTSGMIYPRGTG